MKTIKKKITVPFILIIFMIPFMIMILFNLAMSIYLDRTAIEELRNNTASIEILIRQQLMDSASAKAQQGNTDLSGDKLNNLQDNLKQAKLSLLYSVKNMNIEFLLVTPDGRVLFPKSFDNNFLNERLLKRARAEFNHAEENNIVSFRMGRDKYYASYQALTDSPNSTQLMLISSGSSARGFVRIVNLFLLCITLLAVGLSSVIALIVSKSISSPITRLSHYAKRIGNNEFLTLAEDRSSVEIHELTKSMNEMSSRLKSYDAAQRSFLQNASHELRTPLMSIQGYAEGIARGVFPDTVKTAGIICEESRRLNTLVEELLTLSRIENNNYMSEPVKINLAGVIMDYIQKVNGYAAKEGRIVRLDIQNESMTVTIDEALLSQAVINILSNCIRYAEKAVTVTLFEENGYAVIRIADDGKGIDGEDLPHIFDRFYKGKKGDFGLGLSIAKSSVELMGGTIHAFNDAGAVFFIRLPLVIADF